MTVLVSLAPRSDESLSQLYLEAQIAGVEVSHYKDWNCHTFDGQPEAGCELGVFRSIGTVIFYKDERRWEARARADCSAVDMATLVTYALHLNERFGRTPGHFTRRRIFTHAVSKRTGKRIAHTEVCYQLGVEDLLGAQAAVKLDVDDLVSTLLGPVSEIADTSSPVTEVTGGASATPVQ